MYFTDQGVEARKKRRGEEEVTFAGLSSALGAGRPIAGHSNSGGTCDSCFGAALSHRRLSDLIQV
ncbi:DUF6104 family protein [Streptomyces californicus]